MAVYGGHRVWHGFAAVKKIIINIDIYDSNNYDDNNDNDYL